MQHAASATLVGAVRAHGGEVTCLDARGASLASGGGDRALRWWRWQPGEGWLAAGEARAAHRYGVVCVRWARAGALLASGGVDGCVRLWAGGRPRRALAAPGAAAVRALCWAGGGGARLLAGHDDGTLVAWAAARGELLARVPSHEGALHALCTPAAGALLLSACTHGVLKVYDLAEVLSGVGSPAPLQWVDGAHDLGALCADASAAGAAATGGHDAIVRVWEPEGSGRSARLRLATELRGHTAAVTALRWAGTVLASAALDRTARLWAGDACLLAVAAHPRYLTAVVLAPDARYMITGSNDKTFRMWSLGDFTLADELETPCVALEHFALGDLEGIGPVEEEEAGCEEAGEDRDEGAEAEGARRVWSAVAHAGAINCIAACGELLATASSDGTVRVWRWEEESGEVRELHELGARGYPALAVSFGAGGGVLLSAGLDGSAALWDVRSGVLVRELVVPGGRGGEVGGGGVRGASLSPHRAPLALLATDDGLAPLWRLADTDPHPLHVYSGHAEAATCCAWSADGRVAASGAASGELRVYAPPAPDLLHHEADAHDLGVLSCDFAPPAPDIQLEEGSYLLATGGCDAFVKLWRVKANGAVAALLTMAAHGGAVGGVRWGGALLATAGADRWARVWRVSLDAAGARMSPTAAVPVRGAGGAPSATLLPAARLLAVGALGGELALWQLEEAERMPLDDGAALRYWRAPDVARWLRDAVLNAPGCPLSAARAAELEALVLAAGLTGARLLDDSVNDLLDLFGFDCTSDDVNRGGNETKDQIGEEEDAEEDVEAGDVTEEGTASSEESVAREMLREELLWLRMPPYSPDLESSAPHALRCPLTHTVLESPVRAADGFSYSRDNICEWVSAHGARSPVSGRRLRTAAVTTNYRLRDTLRAFLREHSAAPQLHPTEDTASVD